jgi:hypothetical protein
MRRGDAQRFADLAWMAFEVRGSLEAMAFFLQEDGSHDAEIAALAEQATALEKAIEAKMFKVAGSKARFEALMAKASNGYYPGRQHGERHRARGDREMAS